MIVIITEKPSAKKNFATALGGINGSYKGEKYEIVNSIGHLFAFPKRIDSLVNDEINGYFGEPVVERRIE